MAKVSDLSKHAQAKRTAKPARAPARGAGKSAAAKAAAARPAGGGHGGPPGARGPDPPTRNGAPAGARDIDHFIKTAGLDTRREKEIGQHIGYRYDVNLVPDYSRLTPF